MRIYVLNKVVGNPVYSRSTYLESKLMDFFAFLNFSRQSDLSIYCWYYAQVINVMNVSKPNVW